MSRQNDQLPQSYVNSYLMNAPTLSFFLPASWWSRCSVSVAYSDSLVNSDSWLRLQKLLSQGKNETSKKKWSVFNRVDQFISCPYISRYTALPHTICFWFWWNKMVLKIKCLEDFLWTYTFLVNPITVSKDIWPRCVSCTNCIGDKTYVFF